MNNKKLKNIELGLLIFFILSFVVDFFLILKYEGIDNLIYHQNEQFISSILFYGFMALFINLLKFFLIGGIYLSIKMSNKKFYKERLSRIDIKKYDGYFRDILKGYNPALLSYIDDFKIDFPKDIVAMLLNLKNKGIVDFDELNYKIIILNQKENLTEIEKLLLDSIVDGKVTNIDNSIFSVLVQKEALEKGILKRSLKGIKFKNLFINAIIVFLLMYFSFNILFNMNDESNVVLLIFAIIGCFISISVVIGFVFYFPLYSLIYIYKKISNPYIRSADGEEINIRLEGLKNFLKDFSNMDKRSADDLIIWEDYLIYSVLFNQNIEVINDMYSKYFAL